MRLRLMGSGLFDEFPRLSIVLGHMGERPAVRTSGGSTTAMPARRRPTATGPRRRSPTIFRTNFHVTTSGNFSTQALIQTILQLGADRVMFSVDWPFEEIEHAATWFDRADISENDRKKIGRDNAARLFN